MNATNKLDAYLDSFSRRLRRLTLLQGAAALAIVFVLVGGIGAWFSAESGFASTTTNVFRVLLVLSLVAVTLRFMVDPLQKLKKGLSGKVEHRVPAFNGRVETYTQMKAENNPFLDLLAEDALKISDRNPVAVQVPAKELGAAGGMFALAMLVLLYLLIAGPGFLNYSLRNLLAGWAFDDLLPPQSIAVTPGDQSVRRGSNLRVTSVMEGFNPDEAVIHILNDGEWQEVAMAKSPLGFEFTFFSLQQDARYYVSATGLRSPEFDIGVVDVPSIEKLELTYNYPEWTTRAPETFQQGDVNALPETRIGLKVTTSAPLLEGQLVLNRAAEGMTLNGNEATGEFTVTTEGEYYIAAVVGGEQVRLSDDYFIRLTADGKPELKIVKPGGDYNASNIEEVLTRIEASDDYGLQTLALQYSVNGGGFQKIDLLTEAARTVTAEHMFMLEEMRATATRAVSTNVGRFNVVLSEEEQGGDAAAQGAAAVPAPAQIPLQPGDLISYYAEASDRGQTVRTDMFFIQIQPYNRRYSQSQISGGGGGGGGGGQQDEISQRQRQIIVSAWNLIREQGEGKDNGQVEINSKLLADLQNTLAEQARTLADRARARQLDNDEQIAEFVNNMDMAVQSMAPSAQNLAEVALNDAIQPAQEALQHLLRAESVFNDITVQQQQGGGGGGGGRSGQDLAEMFELEMDLSLNQYETGNQVGQQQQQQQAEDIMKKLDELARRQEQLANNMRNQQQLTDAQRYQQEMLRREAEELQQELEQLQRQQQANNQQGQQGQQQQANNQQGQQGQQSPGQAGQQGQPGQPGQGGQQGGDQQQQQGQQGGEQQIAQSELQRRMESALRAMNQAQQGLEGNLSPEEMQRAAEEASRQLQGARDQVAQEQLAGMQQTFDNMATQSEQMKLAQERMERQLQEAAARALKEREAGTDPNSRGMSLQQEWDLAEEKRQLAAQLQSLQQQMMNAMAQYGTEVPQARNEVERANSELSESEVQQAVNDAALYIDAGYGGLIVGYESAVTQAMRNLSDRLENAQQMVADANSTRGDSDLDRARRQVQDLRAQLQQLAQGNKQQGNQPGQGQPGQQGQPSQQGQPGQQGQQGGQQQGNQQGGGNAGGGDLFGGNRAGGAWNGFDNVFNGPINLPDNFYNNVGEFTRQARDAVQGMDLSPEELAEIYERLRQLEYTQANRNDEILAQEYGEMLALIEQLEVGLQLDGNRNNPGNVRTAQSDAVPEEYQESVAEYFRRLSRE